MSSPDCPSDDRLRAFDHGDVSDLELESVGAHLGACPECVRRLTALARPAAVASALRGPAPVDPPEDSAYWRAVERVTGKPAPGGSRLGPGDRLGEYRLLRRLGQGGMGTVYRAVHARLGREVALKVLRRGAVANPAAAARFEREMRAVGRLRHPNIVHATDAGDAGGTLYLVMELVEGQNLSELVKARGPLPPAEALDVVRQAAAGLQHAHDAGFVHRDVKPSNLIRSADGTVKLLDLGLATLPSAPSAAASAETDDATAVTGEGLTSASRVVGTYEYMAPEQKRDARAVNARADVYALGCTLWFLLTGKPPRPENLLGSGQRPVGLSAELWRRFLATDPGQRFPSAAAAAEALAHPIPPPARISRRRWLVIAGGAAVVPAGLTAYFARLPRTPDAAGPPTSAGATATASTPPTVVPRLGPPPGRLPMTPDEAQTLQKAWADHLGMPVSIEGPAGLKFALIPPGEVGLSTECRVTITRPYYAGVCEVSRAQFRRFVEAKGYKTDAESSGLGGFYTRYTRPRPGVPVTSQQHMTGPKVTWRTPGADDVTEDHPVTQVSWPDVTKFCRWLGEQDGATYRLPSEAEWTWAARAGRVEDNFPGGQKDLSKEAWNSANTDLTPKPVGRLKPNAWGLCDTLGNVGEMCLDWYNVLPVGTFIDWRGPAQPRLVKPIPPSDQHVVKNTSCLSVTPRYTDRQSIGNTLRGDWVTGFRVLREVK